MCDLDASPPHAPSDASAVHACLADVDALLRHEHREDYCGIVYADDLEVPTFVKVYHPKRLGVACGFSDQPPLPGWIVSLTPPVDLHAALVPEPKPRWWVSSPTARSAVHGAERVASRLGGGHQ